MPDDFSPKMPDELKDEINLRIMMRASEAWRRVEQRNQDYRRYEEMVQGIASNEGDGPWPDSCMLVDPLTTQESLSLRANRMQAFNAQQLCTAEPVQPGDEDTSRDFETYINGIFWERKGRQHLEEVDYYTTNRKAAFSQVSWGVIEQKRKKQVYLGPDGIAVEAWERDPNVNYQIKIAEQTTIDEGLVFRAPEPSNVFTDPPNWPNLQTARGVGERMLVTPEQLLLGIQNLGYDEEAVQALIQQAGKPVEKTPIEQLTREQSGISDDIGTDEAIAIVTWIGQCPVWWDGEEMKNEDLIEQDFVWVFAPDHNIVLKFAYWPYTVRGWVRWNMNRIPNQQEGVCLPEMLLTIQEELTANDRLIIDSANIETIPTMWMTWEHAQRFGYPQVKPGGGLMYDPQSGKPEPVVWDKQGILTDLQLSTALRQMGKEISTAHFSMEMPQENTTATAVNAAYGQLNAKFDLYLNTSLTSVEDLVLTMAEISAFHAPEAGLIYFDGQTETNVNADTLKKTFRIHPYATSDQANPQLQIQKASLIQNVQRQFFTDVLALTQQGMLQAIPLVWHGARNTLMAMKVRQVEAFIGPEPSQEIMQGVQAQQQMQQSMGPPPGVEGANGTSTPPPQGMKTQKPGALGPPPMAMPAQPGIQPTPFTGNGAKQ